MALGPGSITFIGFNADGDDGFAFIVIDAIPAGAVIRFSDNEWNGNAIGGTPPGAFNTGEGGSTWTNGATELPAGTVIELLHTSSAGSRVANIGTISGGTISLGSSGELIFSFVGTDENTPTTFLAAVTNNNGGFSGATTSGLLGGTGLTAGSTALVLPGTGGADVAAYNPTLGGSSFATRDAALTAFNTTANWVAQDASSDQDADGTVPDAPFLTDPQSPIAGVIFTIPGPADTTAPTLSSSSPADDATGVAAGANIVLTFDETVQAGSGTITISDGAGDVRVIDVTDAGQITFAGNTVTINPAADLNAGTAYDVVIPSEVITDTAGNPFAGIAANALDFTVAAAPPVLGSVVINEIDADQSGTDGTSFIELYGTAGASLTGYTLVLYNGSNDQSYRAFDLDGLSLDANGYFVLGNSTVPNVDFSTGITGDFLQNGADAVALYLGDATSFPNGTAVTATNLVDAVVYENGHPDDAGLIDVLLPGQFQLNEAERVSASHSLQRRTDGTGGPLNPAAFDTATPTPGAANAVPTTPAASATVTHTISQVQGPGARSALAGAGGDNNAGAAGATVTIEGIVVGDFQAGDVEGRRSLNGFYLQEEAADSDGNPLSSEGIFIFGGYTNVNEGDQVRVTGTVSEFFGMTEITVTGVTVVSSGNALPAATDIDLPTASATLNLNNRYQPDLEAYEGMLVRFPETLTITEQFNIDRFNEIKLAAGGRIENFTNENAPSTSGYANFLQEVGKRTITYDDGQNTQNELINDLDGFDPDDDGTPSPLLPGEPSYNTASAFRMGDAVTNLTGVLDYQWAGDASTNSTWRVRATNDGANTFVHENDRPVVPPEVGGSLKVASFNVLNYFVTLDAGGATIANGLAPRGANTVEEFNRQTEKLVNFILTLDVDVIGLTELQNDFFDSNPGNNVLGDVSSYEGVAIGYPVDQLNAAAGSIQYAWINPSSQLDSNGGFGGDAISVGFIYKPSKVEVAFGTTVQKLDDSDAEAAALLGQSSIGHIFNGVNTSRAAMAVTFEELATDEQFTAVINHFKSKSGNGAAGSADEDKLDGQGAWQNQRELAAKALVDWIDGNPTGTTDP